MSLLGLVSCYTVVVLCWLQFEQLGNINDYFLSILFSSHHVAINSNRPHPFFDISPSITLLAISSGASSVI